MSVKISTMHADDPITKDAFKQEYTSIHVGGPMEFDTASTSYDDLLRSLGIRRDKPSFPRPKQVIYHDPATICLWPDGTKTVVKCHDGDTYSREFGLLACIAKHAYGDHGRWYDVLRDNDAMYGCASDADGRQIHAGDKVHRVYTSPDEVLTVHGVDQMRSKIDVHGHGEYWPSKGYRLATSDAPNEDVTEAPKDYVLDYCGRRIYVGDRITPGYIDSDAERVVTSVCHEHGTLTHDRVPGEWAASAYSLVSHHDR